MTNDEMTLTLHNPVTEEEWDAITDVDFDYTDKICFHTKNGKEVTFVKPKVGKWIYQDSDRGDDMSVNDLITSTAMCDGTLVIAVPKDVYDKTDRILLESDSSFDGRLMYPDGDDDHE